MIAVAKGKSNPAEESVSLPEPDDKRGGRKSAPVQIDKELARMAAVIAAHDDITISDFLTPVVKQYIMTHYERVKVEIQQRIDRMKKQDEGK